MEQNILDVNFSPLVVGTVQFGMPYGIANRAGQPSFEQVCKILACAVEGGATTLDTAAAYGDSERILGRALKEIGALDQVTIVSKVLHLAEQERSRENAEKWIRDSVIASLAHLGIKSLPVCLIHDYADLDYFDILLELKREGLVQHAGISVDLPEQLERVIATPGMEAIQLPTSILDQRFIRSGRITKAAAGGIAIFVRSVFLQGLILMPVEEIIPELKEVIPIRRALQRIADEARLTMPEMALRYGLSLPGITGVLTGVETVEQMAANVAIAARGPLPGDVVEEINRSVPDLPDSILYPWHWPE